MLALPLDKPPPYWGSTTLEVGLKQAANRVLSILDNDTLSGLVGVDDLVHTGYIIMCQRPGLRWKWLVCNLYVAYLPVGRNPDQSYTGYRPAEWGSTYYPIPDSVALDPTGFAEEWGLRTPRTPIASRNSNLQRNF